MVGRPRGVDDAVILRATAEVIGRKGPAGLTLGAVAQETGVVPGTLVQRFGSKRGLLLALAEASAKDAEASYERAAAQGTAEAGSALAALVALTVDSMAPMTTPERFANHLAFLCVDLTDPQFHQHALTIHRARGRATERLLAQAVTAGELRRGTDAAALAGTVQAVTAGAGLTWALEREGALPDRLRREIGALLAPHMTVHEGEERR